VRILGIDYGHRRVGLALSDPLGITAQGYGVLENRGERPLLEEIGERIREKDVHAIVIGLPKGLDGSLGKKAAEVLRFAGRLREEFGLPVTCWDERLSTREAERRLLEAGLSHKKRKKKLDVMAAQLILQSFLEAKGHAGTGNG
jgi:putative Holliday junction resolvase